MELLAKIKSGQSLEDKLGHSALTLLGVLESFQGQDVKITISKAGDKKSNQQLAYYYGVVIESVRIALTNQGNDTITIMIKDRPIGLPLTKDDIDLLLKSRVGMAVFGMMPTKSDMLKGDMSLYIDRCIMWIAKWLDYAVPPPSYEE